MFEYIDLNIGSDAMKQIITSVNSLLYKGYEGYSIALDHLNDTNSTFSTVSFIAGGSYIYAWCSVMAGLRC